ncbi:MAG: response regulator transcription factor [Sulfitobacter sp.]|nr:response regulator transcription factor [Sulfitobacter sp.]
MADISAQRVLVVDDEEYITDLLSTSLRFQGFEVETAGAGFEALSKVGSFNPDLIILDVNMPNIDGFEVCRRLRADGDLVPVIFLTAKDSKDDMLSGFTKGGDDYMTKPFSLEEVVARINAVLRRTGQAAVESKLHKYHDLVMDEDAHRVARGGEAVELSPTEWKLLRYLLINAERVLSKTQILDHVWHYDFGGDASSVETYISYLRKKVDHVEPKLIQTVRGAGYTIRTES